MNLTELRRKRIILPTIAAVAVAGIGGTVWSASANDNVQRSERERVGAAGVKAAGGGTAVDVETSDDLREAYEVEVRMDDGTEITIDLDQDLNVVSQDSDDRDDIDDNDRDDNDRALSAEERAAAGQAALEAVGGGTVEDVEGSDDRGEAYEVEVRDGDNIEWDVDLDADYNVLNSTAGD